MTSIQLSDTALAWPDSFNDELLGFLTKRLRCAETAADITQETLLRLHENAKTQPPDNARALAYRIAINLANDYQRRLKVRERYHEGLAGDYLADTQACPKPGPEQVVMAKQRFQQFQTVLAKLPPDCRQAFLLHSIDHLTYGQIAERLGISESMVSKHLARALKHCLKHMGDD